MTTKTWNVYTRGYCLGQAHEDNEELARCAALHTYGLHTYGLHTYDLHENDMEHMTREKIASLLPHRIFPDDDFIVQKD